MSWDDELQTRLARDFSPAQEFTLDQVYGYEREFARLYPSNRHVRQKLRQTLQHLRDLDFLTFVDNNGLYRRK